MKKKYVTYGLHPFFGLTMEFQKRVILLLFVIFGFFTAQGQVTVSGAVTGDGSYATLGAAFAAIGTVQPNANINIDITANTTESSIAALGAGNWTTLRIKPSGGSWTVSGSLASELIQFNGADNVTIDGLNLPGDGLTISNTNTTVTAGTVVFKSDATNNTIKNCSVLGSTTVAHATTSGGVIYFAAGTTTGNDNNTILNCNIGPAGANLPTRLIYSKGTDTAAGANSGTIINNCNLYDYFISTASVTAIKLDGGNTDWSITNNRMYQTADRAFTGSVGVVVYGIMIVSNVIGDNFQITGNKIGYANSAGTGTLRVLGATTPGYVQGIYLNALPNGSHNINNNDISNISLTSSGGTFYGIYNDNGIGTSNTININGNTVKNIETITTTAAVNPIMAGRAFTLNCSNNTIDNITRTGAGTLYGISYTAPQNITLNANTITNLGSTHTTSTGAISGINTGTGVIETITNNTITGLTSSSTGNQAVIGINVSGGVGNKTIQNNTVSNFTVPTAAIGNIHGIRMAAGGTTNTISGNIVNSLSGGTSVYGIQLASGTTNSVFKNKVYGLSSSAATPTVYGIGISGGTTYTIYNNIVGDLTAPAANANNAVVGMNISGPTTVNAYHNTVVLNASSTGPNFGSTAMSVAGPPNLTMQNNILVNTSAAMGTGNSVAFRKPNVTTTYDALSNNNLFYGTAIFSDNTTIDVTLSEFKNRVGNRDMSSVTENPYFLSLVGSDANYLHINPAIPAQTESGGVSVASVTDDFDGNVRNSSTPDIGADEFAGIPLDLSGPIIVHVPSATCATGSRTISATITDVAGVPVTGAGLPVVYWRINTGAYTAAVGTSMGGGVYDFTIGAGSVAGDVMSYYFVAQDAVATPNVAVYPAVGASGFTANPPAAATPPTTPKLLYTPMSGVYTVGVAGNYATLTAAVADYNVRCLTGSVTFSLLDATYSAGETFPVTIQQNADASAVNTLTIQPASGVTATITGSNDSALLILNGADNVTINGLNSGGSGLIISNTSTAATAGISTIKFQADATNNTITNCSLLGSVTVPNATDGGVVYFATGTTTGNDGNTISNCNIGPAGTNLPSKLIYGKGTTTSAAIANSGVTITNCNLYDYFLTGGCAAVYALGGNTDWTVTNNKIYQTVTRTFTAAGIMYGIYFADGTNGSNVQITGNTIGYDSNMGTGTLTLAGTSAGGFQGIYFNGQASAVPASNLNNNVVSNISLTSSSGAFYGIYNGITSASGGTVNINGNTVRNVTTTTTTGTVNPIYGGVATTLNCSNNTIDNISRTGAGILFGINYGAAANVTLNANTITNLSSTHATSTSNFSGIHSANGALIETITNNTITGLTTSSTGIQTVCGINVQSVAANKTIQNNTLSNFTVPATATGIIHGIRMAAGGALNDISGNTVSAFSGPNSTTGTNGITITTGTTNNVYNNRVYGLNSPGAAAVIYGMAITGGTTNNVYNNKVHGLSIVGTGGNVIGFGIMGGATHNIYNNIVGDLSAPIASGTGEPHSVIGMNCYSYTGSLNVYNNTVVLNGTNTGTNFGSSAIYVGAGLTLRNNILINNLPANGIGVSVVLRLAGGIANYGATSDNNLLRGTAIHTKTGVTDLDVTLSAFKTRVGNRDVSSVDENPTFVSVVGSDANYLHINTTVPTLIESGGAPIATVNDDFDGNARNATTPDIGADEFAGTPAPVVVINTVGITPTGNQCVATSRTVTANITAGGNDITSVVLNYSFNGVAQTPIAMTGGTLTAGTTSAFTATIPVAVPVNANVTWNVTATDPTIVRVISGTPYSDEPLFGKTATATASSTTICNSASTVLSAGINSNGSATIGTATTRTGTTETLTAFCNRYSSYRMQIVYTAAELNAAGLSAGPITSMAFNIFSIGSSASNTAFTVKMGPTAATTFTNFISNAGFTTVFPSGDYTHAVGQNVINFSTPYAWDGLSNVVVEVSHNGINSLYNAETYYTATVGNTIVSAINGGAAGTPSTKRLNIVLTGGTPAVANYSWSDGSTVVGTGNNLSVSPTATTTYTATLTSLGCTVVSNPVTITVTPNVTTTFAPVTPICSGSALSALPTTSIEGIVGTWSPALNNTATTTYTFTPNAGQCGTPATITITVNSTPAPTGTASQSFASGQTINNIAVTGTNVVWYASAADAANGVNPLPGTTVLVDNTVYYATQTISGCTSATSLAVTATVVLGNNAFDSKEFKYYPNPVTDVLNVAYTQRMQNIEIYNAIGQQVAFKVIDKSEAMVDMSELPSGTYLVKVISADAVKTIKIIKK